MIMKTKIIILLTLLPVLFLHQCEKESKLPTDGDGNTYDTIVIGTQVWLAENLKTTKYNNRISIPLITDNAQWISTTSAAYCWYENNSDLKDTYGALYNWWAIKVSNLCPVGYHVPNSQEWNVLIEYFGGKDIAGGKLKMTGNTVWKNNIFATNESGFSAVGGGFRQNSDGVFASLKLNGSWWSTVSGINEDNGYGLIIYDASGEALLGGGVNKKKGISVRCLKND